MHLYMGLRMMVIAGPFHTLRIPYSVGLDVQDGVFSWVYGRLQRFIFVKSIIMSAEHYLYPALSFPLLCSLNCIRLYPDVSPFRPTLFAKLYLHFPTPCCLSLFPFVSFRFPFFPLHPLRFLLFLWFFLYLCPWRGSSMCSASVCLGNIVRLPFWLLFYFFLDFFLLFLGMCELYFIWKLKVVRLTKERAGRKNLVFHKYGRWLKVKGGRKGMGWW